MSFYMCSPYRLQHKCFYIFFVFPDINECQLDLDNCEQLCVNRSPNETYPEEYICECYEGFQLVDGSCQRK